MDELKHLRHVGLWAMVVCLACVPLAMFPSVDIYRDVNDCLAAALAWHHGSSTCHPRYKFVESVTPALPVIPLMLGLALASFALKRWPRPPVAMLWALAAVPVVIVCAMYTFDFEIFGFGQKRYHATAAVLGLLDLLVGITGTVTFLLMPIVMIARAIEKRRAAAEALPAARVVRG